jgi:hypothetical protein
VASAPPLDLELTPLHGPGRTISQWLTNFHLGLFVLDPFTNESAWILPTVRRIMNVMKGADVRVAFLVTCDTDDARAFLGPLADEYLVLTDPDRLAVKGLGLERLPALVWLELDGSVGGAAEGWDPEAWERVLTDLARVMKWSVPLLPAPGDPAPFAGTPAV